MRVGELARYHVQGLKSGESLVDKLRGQLVVQEYGGTDRQSIVPFILILGQAQR